MSIKVAFGQVRSFNDDTLIMAKQLGAEGIHFNRPPIMGEDTWSFEGIKWLKEYCDSFGLPLIGIENIPVRRFGRIILGIDGRDEQIEKYIDIIKSFGRLGIPFLGHGFSHDFVWRTSMMEPIRGGALSSSFDSRLVKPGGNAIQYMDVLEGEPPTREKLWDNYRYFMKAIMPVSEKAGVKISLHPSDPPVPVVNGNERIFVSIADFKKAMEIADSPMWGLNLCLGCCSQMGGEASVLEAVRYFGPIGRIFNVHLRDVQGSGEYFKECFLGEGNFNPAKVLYELKVSGYDGYVIDDHVPQIVSDTAWKHTARANQTGYIQGMLKMLEFCDNCGCTGNTTI